MRKEQVKIILAEGAQMPKYGSPEAIGADLFANNESVICVWPGASALIPTGVFLDLGEGVEAQVRSRSGLAAKNNISVLCSPGTIDPDYQGEVKVILFNHSKDKFLVNRGDRVAQIVFRDNCFQANWKQVEAFETKTERGEGGFGSTGV